MRMYEWRVACEGDEEDICGSARRAVMGVSSTPRGRFWLHLPAATFLNSFLFATIYKIAPGLLHALQHQAGLISAEKTLSSDCIMYCLLADVCFYD